MGIATGVIFAYAGDLPRISALDDYAPSTISRVYGARGEIVGEFAIERREVIPYERISPYLEQAILAAEDHSFYQHIGLSIPRIVVTLIKDIIERRMYGASTLTQQLTRKLFLTDDKTPERKIKEAILAIQIEKRYTKREIFTLYCNQMYFGHGVYGVEAASRLYFGKSAKDVSIEEAALIAGILQGNVRQSPYVNREAALRRRNYALGRMAEVGFITAAQAEELKKKPIVVRPDQPGQTSSAAPYFLEEVRRELESRYGAKQLYENGLSIQTAIDLRLQEAATQALHEGLRRIDKRRGFRKPRRNVIAEGHTIESFRQPRWDRPMSAGQIVPAVVTAVDGAAIQLRVGGTRVTIDRKGYAWTRKTSPTELVTRGDLVETRLQATADGTAPATGTLEQAPEVEGAVLAIDNRTGQILAMIGGYSFERSKFNRATQAYRQVGSAFKPICLHGRDRQWLHAGHAADGHAGELPWRGGSARVYAAQLRPRVRRTNHAATSPRTITQCARHPRDGSARPQPGDHVRPTARPRVATAALPGGGAWRRGGDTRRNDERVFGLSQSGREDAAVLRAQGHRP